MALSLPLLSPLLEPHHHIWEAVSFFFLMVLWLRGVISRGFSLQLPLWVVLLLTPFFDDFKVLGAILKHGYIATFAALLLWIFNGVYLLYRAKKSH